MKGVLDFLDITPAAGFNVPAREAIERFYDKGLKKSFAWQDVAAAEHANSFTVAKMMDMDLLADVKASLEEALESGTVYREWADNMIPQLQAKGWWGRKAVLDPLTGQTVVAQLGSPARLQTIFRTNMASAYAAGHWDMIEDQAEDAPFLLYDAIDDYRTRPAHKAWDGKVYPITDKFWKTHTPPCGWNCRCTVIQLDEADLEDLGLKPEKSSPTGTYDWTNPRTGQTFKIPNGVDPTFGQAAAKRIDNIIALAQEKAKALPDELAAKAKAALDEIDKHLAEKTPYISTAIKAEQAKGASDPVELLNKAKAEAAKTKQSVGLTKYKAALLKGKKPEPLAQSAFDALPQEAKLAIIQEVEAKSAILKANAEAEAKLEAFKAASPDSKNGKAYASLTKQGKLDGLTTIEKANALEAEVILVQQAKTVSDALSSYKAAILKGKTPSQFQSDTFNNAPADVKAKILADIEKKKPTVAPAPAAKLPGDDAIDWTPTQQPDTLSPELPEGEISGLNLTQIGPQKGSNPGGSFQDTETGDKWYIKFIAKDKAKNEMLTAKLYELAGVESVDYRFVTLPDGREGLASKWIDGLIESREALEALAPGVAEGFATDAWLANWDVVGMGYDNMKLLKNRAVRVDTGGGLIYRAQGGEKGAAFGDKVGELLSLRDANTNPSAANVFRAITDQQVEASVARVLLIPDEAILEAVRKFGPGDMADRDELARKLIARKQDLFERYPGARPKVGIDKPAPPVRGFDVTDAEQAAILDSRANGYALKIDAESIEDHSVVFSTFRDKGGGPGMTRAAFKLTPEAMKKLEGMMAGGKEAPKVAADFTDVGDQILTLVKGVNSRASEGKPLEQKNLDRWLEAKKMLELAISKAQNIDRNQLDSKGKKALDKALDSMKHWYKEGAAKLDGKGADDAAVALDGKVDLADYKAINQKPQQGEPGKIKIKERREFVNIEATFDKGFATIQTREKIQDAIPIKRFIQADLDGVRLSYVPSDNTFTLEGLVYLDVDEVSAAASTRILETIKKLGVESERTTDVVELDLYTHRVARAATIRDATKTKALQTVAQLSTPEDRIKARVDLLKKWTGIDITARPEFNSYKGIRQAFGHGRLIQNRPDFDEFDFAEFESIATIYNNPCGLHIGTTDGATMLKKLKQIVETGGQYTSRLDLVRRGAYFARGSGTSIAPDMESGGGAVMYTRAVLKERYGEAAGIHWKPVVAKRIDAISYKDDSYGRTKEEFQKKNRQQTAAELVQITRDTNKTNYGAIDRIYDETSNETVFRDSLSIFDDIEKIVFPTESDADDFMVYMMKQGYKKWPDGRELNEVVVYSKTGGYGYSKYNKPSWIK